jgi:EAL domain-containing protein (putative c-di-GMP-specific phosphodiesterase class I)
VDTPSLVTALDRTRRTRALVEELINDPAQLGPDFQPVRRLTDNAVVGWKATGRGRPGTELADTLALLGEAASLGLVERLDWAFRALVFDRAVLAGVRETVHLTPEPQTYLSACPPRLAVSVGRGRRELAVAAEVHDDGLADLRLLEQAVAEMRGWGWQIVLADVADERDALHAVDLVRPDVVQVDLSRAGRRGSAAVAAFLEAGLSVGAEVMALGVDSAGQRAEAMALGATVGRGLLLGTPGPLPL